MTGFWADRDWRINRMMWRFNRSGGFGKETWPYNDAPPEIRETIHRMVSLADHEVELVVYFRDHDTWTLLTSDRLTGMSNGSGFNADLRTISDIHPVWKDIVDGDGKVITRPIERLSIEADRKSYTVSIEGPFKSGPYQGLRNAVLMVTTLGSRRPPIRPWWSCRWSR